MKIVVENSISQIIGVSIAQLSSLKKILRYELPGSNYSHFGPKHKYLIDKHGYFPTGLLYLVQEWAKDAPHLITHDKRVKTGDRPTFKLREPSFKPYPEQKEAAKQAYLKHRGIICAPTGVGKSVMIALTISRLNARSIVVVPSLELKRQLTATLQQFYGSDAVGTLKQGRDIVVENIDALPLDPRYYQGYDAIILDEFHHAAASTYRELNEKAWNCIYYRIGFTATPWRSQDTERLLLESVLSTLIYKIDYDTAIRKGYIAPLEAFYVELPKQVGGKAHEKYPTVYSRLVVNNDHRNNIIADMILGLASTKQSVLCLVKEIAHGEILAHLTNKHFIKGENDNNKEALAIFNRGGHQVIGTTGVIGEGVDTKPCEWVIIAGLGKAKTAIMQQIGRGFRVFPGKETCKVILFKDNSHKWTLNHFKEQCKILKEEYGITPTKLEIT